MSSTPATNAIGIEQQAAGENLNTWGSPKLNQDKQILINMIVGFTPLSVTGNTSIVETNYSASNTTETAVLQLNAGGGLAAAFSLTLANRARRLIVWNNTSFAASNIKLSASTGFSLPANRWTWVVTDGTTDVYNLGSNYAGLTTPTNNGDLPNWGAVQTAIANASLPATAGTIRNSGTDTTSGYHLAKHDIALTGLLVGSWDTENPAGNELARLNLDDRRIRRRSLFVGQV